MLNHINGQLELRGILPKTSPQIAKRAKATHAVALAPASVPVRRKKHSKNSVIQVLRDMLAVADEAEVRGMTLNLSVDGWYIKNIRDELAKTIASLWFPQKRGLIVPHDLIKELGAALPPAGYDRDAPHPLPRICDAIHAKLPSRFSNQWRATREQLREEAKLCVGIRKALRARLAEGKRLALQLLKKNIAVTVDDFGDLTIDDAHNPFTHLVVGEAMPGSADAEIKEILAIFGHDPNRTLTEVLPPTVFAILEDENDAGIDYRGTSGSGFLLDHFTDWNVDSTGSIEYQLLYRDGIFALVRVQDYPDPQPGERAQRCQIDEGHRYIDATGVECIAKGHAYMLRDHNEWVTYVGPPPKHKANTAREKPRRGSTRKKSSS